MSNIQENIAKNIAKLRKSRGWTQTGLAKELNYSDKAVSKWERGDSTPDIEILLKISEVFNVDINFLLKDHPDEDYQQGINPKTKFIKDLLILILFGVAILGIAVVIFVYMTFIDSKNVNTFWVSFIWAAFLCAFITALFGSRKKYKLCNLISESVALWTLITSIYCTCLVSNFGNFWMLYLVGIPIQAAFCISFFMKNLK